jgi:hypothetical protein
LGDDAVSGAGKSGDMPGFLIDTSLILPLRSIG